MIALRAFVAKGGYEAPPSDLVQWSIGVLLVAGAVYTLVVAIRLAAGKRLRSR